MRLVKVLFNLHAANPFAGRAFFKTAKRGAKKELMRRNAADALVAMAVPAASIVAPFGNSISRATLTASARVPLFAQCREKSHA